MWRITKIILALFLIPSLCWAGVNFDDVDDYIDCGTMADAVMTENGALTISAWIYPETIGTSGASRIIGRQNGGVGVYLYKSSTTTVSFQVVGSTTLTRKAANNALTLNIWQHILLTWDGSTNAENVHIYVNGIEVAYQTTTNGITPSNNSAASLIIGNRDDFIRCFDGTITEVAVWNTIVSANEIALLAHSRVKGMPLLLKTANLKGYWPLDEGSHGVSADLDTAWDMSGNGNNGNPDNGANNTGLTWMAESILTYSPGIIGAK